ncbi:hypothetical protein [Sulfitobacter sp.]|uniref:hypothetical protein n=1 Tax=Sulfitobacter sp. TaxID=1903071 RepID=UPI003EF2282A
MAYMIEQPPHSRLPLHLWWRGVAIPLQMVLALGLAIATLYVSETFWPNTAQGARAMYYVVLHENGHALPEVLTPGGEVKKMVFNLDGSGHVLSKGASDTTFRIGLGLMLPVILAALLITFGLLRWCNAALLGIIFFMLFWQAVFFGRDLDMRVFWAITYWAVPAMILSFCPWPLVRSASVLFYGVALAWGCVDALPYLHAEYVILHETGLSPAPLAPQGVLGGLGQTPPPDQVPSDIRQLADYWNAEDIAEPRSVVLALMLTCILISCAAVLIFILRHRS